MWDITFQQLFDRCLKLHSEGRRDFANFYDQNDRDFLASIGYQEREFYDFIEDLNNEQAPPPARRCSWQRCVVIISSPCKKANART